MSEPRTVAPHASQVVPGVWNWHIQDERISFRSDAHAVSTAKGVVLIDPLPLDPSALQQLGDVLAICLTAACHQRAAWRYRRECSVPVYAPDACRDMDEAPDARFTPGDELPGGLRAIHTPGPESAHYAFLRAAAPGVLFCADLLMRSDTGELQFVPGEYHDDPHATVESVESLLPLEFSVLCLDHGPPLTQAPHAALRKVLSAR